MGVSGEDRTFLPGSLVFVKRGHHAGSVFAVIGAGENSAENDRILIADGRKISARKPKRKSPRHVETAGIVSAELTQRLAKGKRIDDGWLAEIVSRLEIEISRLTLEEVGRSVCRKTTS
jgi:ribosomal protein L14E/L6E/L27E